MPISEIYNCDCMEYMKKIPNKYFDLSIVDPPYGINVTKMQMGSTSNCERTAVKLRKGILNSGSGKLKNRVKYYEL